VIGTKTCAVEIQMEGAELKCAHPERSAAIPEGITGIPDLLGTPFLHRFLSLVPVGLADISVMHSLIKVVVIGR